MRTSQAVMPAAVIMLLLGCRKDEAGAPSPTPSSRSIGSIDEYALLTTGNYWVYERRVVDSTGQAVDGAFVLDSVFVEGDTLVDGSVYKKIGRTIGWPSPNYNRLWRISGDRLVDHDWGVQFCTAPLDEVVQSDLIPNAMTTQWSVASSTFPIAVPSGAFDAYRMLGEHSTFGTLPPSPAWKNSRSYWVAGVGRVQYFTYYANSETGFRYDLVRYSIQ